MLWYLGRQQSGRVVCQDRIYTLGIRHEKVSRSGPGPRPYLSPGIAMIPCFPRMMKDDRHVFSASTSFSGRPPPYVLGTGSYTRYSCADGARKSSHMLIAHRTICSLPIEPYARCPSSHMLVAHRAICSLPIEPYAHCPSSHMLIAHRAICSLPIEPYAHYPSSHMLIAHRAICSLPIEPYAHCLSSHMLITHRAICSLSIEPYAHCPLSHMLIAHRAICSLSIEPYAHCPLSHMLLFGASSIMVGLLM